MEKLPLEILEHIFTYLTQTELLLNIDKVCLKWKQLVSTSASLWKRIDFSYGNASYKEFPLFLRHFPVVQHLIKYLNIQGYRFDQIIYAEKNIQFSSLITLCLALYSTKFFDNILLKCPNLEHLELTLECSDIDIGECLQKLSTFTLKSFKFNSYSKIPGFTYDNAKNEEIFDKAIHKFIEKQISLQKLSITTDHIIEEMTLIDIFKLCTDLEHLGLDNECLSDSVFTSLEQKLKLLSITLTGSYGLTDNGLKALVEKAQKLKVISLVKLPVITVKGLFYISQNCHDLEDLTIDGKFWKSVSSGLVHIAAGCQRLKSLYCLNSFLSNDFQIITVARSCRILQSIRIDGAYYLTDHALFSLAENCLLLNDVSFSVAESFTIHGIVSLILSCSKLKIVRFCGCKNISEMHFVDMKNELNEVQEIKKRYLERVRSEKRNASAIEVLDFESCSKVSNNTVLQLVPLCPELKHLHTPRTAVAKNADYEHQLRCFCKSIQNFN